MNRAYTSVHVDFEINCRDCFRVNLALAKWRIIIGLAVACVPIVVLGYFFLLIDEAKLFLQLSPLFVALPLFAVVGQILRLHAACRKYISGLPPSQRQFHYLFQTESDGYDVTCSGSFGHVAWGDVLKAIEKPAYFLLYLNRYDTSLVLKSGFHVASDINVLRSILCAQLGARARVQN